MHNRYYSYLVKILDILNIKDFFVSKLLYNKAGLFCLNIINKIRWQYVDLTIIIWPPAKNVFDEIQSDIAKEHEILKIREFEVAEINFKSFVEDIYAIDHASQNKIKNKLDELKRNPLKMRLLIVRFLKPEIYAVDLLNRVRCRDVNNLKINIRKKYESKITNYIYDLIIHSTEIDYQTNDIYNLFKKYNAYNFTKIK
jgi:hypothetical protein